MASVEYHGKYKKLFPGVLSSNSFLTIYVLHLLKKKNRMYGKEIADEITDRLKGTWSPSHGLIYPMLRSMEESGLVQGNWEGTDSKKTRRFYEITEEGENVLHIEAENIKPMFEKSKQMIDIVMDDLY